LAQESLPVTAKACTKCGEIKPAEGFYASVKTRSGLTSWCRECTKAKTRSRGRDTERTYLLKKYGLTPERYADILQAQGGRCAICGIPQGETKRSFAVDHDHSCCPADGSCGRCVRGLLCVKCNLGLGSFGDNIASLRSATDYLESYRG
jgi:NAD-dependent dihydropyrimidine dehydrogenase PreA subunit